MGGNGTVADAERACFETGIKLGALYHQFVGTPVSEDSVESLEEGIREAVESQRYVVKASVSVEGVEHNRYGYDEVTGEMLDVHVVVEYGEAVVEASLEEDDGYPSMVLEEVSQG